jgi:hypothetical protein
VHQDVSCAKTPCHYYSYKGQYSHLATALDYFSAVISIFSCFGLFLLPYPTQTQIIMDRRLSASAVLPPRVPRVEARKGSAPLVYTPDLSTIAAPLWAMGSSHPRLASRLGKVANGSPVGPWYGTIFHDLEHKDREAMEAYWLSLSVPSLATTSARTGDQRMQLDIRCTLRPSAAVAPVLAKGRERPDSAFRLVYGLAAPLVDDAGPAGRH